MNSPRLLILLVALMMLPMPAALGAMTTEYTREDENGSKTTVESVTLDLAEGESDDLTSIVFPNSEVMDTQLGISGAALEILKQAGETVQVIGHVAVGEGNAHAALE